MRFGLGRGAARRLLCARAMNSRTSALSFALLALSSLAALGFAQGRPRSNAVTGPYRVIMTKEIVTPGSRPNETWREHEYLTEVFNGLDAQGLVPVMIETVTQGDADGKPGTEHRMIVVCMPK